MALRTRLKELVGDWFGTNRVWLSPGEPVRESETSATIALAAHSAFLTITYTWSDSGEPQDGILIVRLAQEPSSLDMVWIDSWHTGGKFMEFRGEEHGDGQVSAIGSYSAPEGPDWGWRITLTAGAGDGYEVRMYNIPPHGIEALAVEAKYIRSISVQ
jgi:hypothetical protein